MCRIDSASAPSSVLTRLEDLDQLPVRVPPDPDHRMDHEVDRVPLAPELHRHRVDDERHVVADDLDHRVRGLPAVVLELGVVDVDLGLAGLAVLGQVPVRDRGAVEIERTPTDQVLPRDPVVVLAHEDLARRRLLIGEAFPDAGADGVDQLRFEIRRLQHQLTPPLILEGWSAEPISSGPALGEPTPNPAGPMTGRVHLRWETGCPLEMRTYVR